MIALIFAAVQTGFTTGGYGVRSRLGSRQSILEEKVPLK